MMILNTTMPVAKAGELMITPTVPRSSASIPRMNAAALPIRAAMPPRRYSLSTGRLGRKKKGEGGEEPAEPYSSVDEQRDYRPAGTGRSSFIFDSSPRLANRIIPLHWHALPNRPINAPTATPSMCRMCLARSIAIVSCWGLWLSGRSSGWTSPGV